MVFSHDLSIHVTERKHCKLSFSHLPLPSLFILITYTLASFWTSPHVTPVITLKVIPCQLFNYHHLSRTLSICVNKPTDPSFNVIHIYFQ